jgi:carboxylesterase type B
MPSDVCPASISEDCLYLNVFVPKSTNTSNKAVMLFIHGGNFQYQGADSLLIDGRYFANYSDTIIVTIQYRLGMK